MRTERFKGALLSALVIASLITPLLVLSPSPVHAALTPHDPIHIDGNDDFTPANGVTSGSGTASDPYIIENWDINAEYGGIWVRNTTAHFIIRNVYVHDGVRPGFPGISTWNLTNGKIDNNILENNHTGIVIGPFGNNLVSNNFMGNNHWGIYLDNSKNNTISNNLLENNGIGIEPGRFSNNNHIYYNNFVNNVTQARDSSSNYWDNGYPSGGNYWSDYTGEDADNDGIGDTPYFIPEGTNQDRYPFMNPTAWALPEPLPKPPSAPTPAPTRWPLIAGIVGVIAIIGIVAALYMRRRKPTEFRW